MSMLDKEIGHAIQVLRKAKGMTQIELAEMTGLSFQQIGKYEKGQTRFFLDRLIQLSHALEVDVEEMIRSHKNILRMKSPLPKYKISQEKNQSTMKPFLLNQDELSLITHYRKIKNKKIKEGLLKQLKGIIEVETGK